jgi:DNA-binding helix-turn-helix protein
MANRLKELRLELGLSQPDMAKYVGLSINSYLKLERDFMKYNPSLNSILKIADKLGVSVDYLTERQTEFAARPDYIDAWHQQFLARVDLTKNRTSKKNMEDIVEEATLTRYPYNLLGDIFKYNDLHETSAVSEAFFVQLERIIDQIPQRDRQIIRERYLIGNTFEKISKKHNTSRQRVQQIVTERLVEIRHELTPFLFDPTQKVEKLMKLAEELESRCNELDDTSTLDPIYKLLGRDLLAMHLSNRTTNALMNAGCEHLIDIVLLIAHKDIRNVRNLGNASRQEVYDYLVTQKLLPDDLDFDSKFIDKRIRLKMQETLEKLDDFAISCSKDATVVETINQTRLRDSEYTLINTTVTHYDQSKRITKDYSNGAVIHEYKL